MASEGNISGPSGRQAVLTTLLFTDIVGSTALKQNLGDQQAVSLILQHHQLLRSNLALFPLAQEIETAGDSFFIQFSKPSDAVKFALLFIHRLRQWHQTTGAILWDRIGIHLGEVMIEDPAEANKARGFYGIQVDTCARIMSLAQGGQILMTRAVFDNARQALKGTDLAEVGTTSWHSHGLYAFKGLEEPLEVCETRLASAGSATAPASTDKATRASGGDELVVGWRPAAGDKVRGTPWVLKEKLGEGGFGEAWLGEHEAMKEKRVFKFCFRADRVRALKREVTLLRLLREKVEDHPHIVKMLDVYLEEPPYHLVEEYVAGKDLVTWCRTQGGLEKISLEARLEIVAQVADGLQAAHEAGVLHRDIKPGNILMQGQLKDLAALPAEQSAPARLLAPVRQKLAERGAYPSDAKPARWRESGATLWEIGQHVRAKLADFGIGQVISQEYLAGATRAGFSMTVASAGSALAGTHLYMAPEVLAGKGASPRSDIYSLGVVLYQFLVGDFKQPVGTGWEEDIPEELLRDDLRQCLARNPKDRFTTAGQLAKQLRAYKNRRDDLEQSRAEQEERETGAYWRGIILTGSIALILLLAMAGLAIYAFWGSPRDGRWKEMARQNVVSARFHNYERALESKNLALAFRELHDLWRFLAATYAKNSALFRPEELGNVKPSEFNDYLARIESKDADESRLSQEIAMRLIGILNNQRQALVPISILIHSSSTIISTTPDQRWEILWDRESVAFKDRDNGALQASYHQPPWVNGPKRPAEKRRIKIENGAVLIKEDATGKTLATLKPGKPIPRSVVVSSDGRYLLTVGLKELKNWDISTGTVISSFDAEDRKIGRAEFSPDGRRIIVACQFFNKKSVIILDGETGRPLTDQIAYNGYGRMGYWFSPNGNWLITYNDNTQVWDLATGKLLATIPGEPQDFDPTGEGILTLFDQSAQVFDLRTGTPLTQAMTHRDEIRHARYSPNSRWIATTSVDGAARIWDAATGKPHTQWLEAEKPALVWTGGEWREISWTAPSFSPDNRFLIITGPDWAVIREVASGKELTEAVWHPKLKACHISPDGHWVVTVGPNNLKLWDLNQLKPGASIWQIGPGVQDAEFSPSEDWVAIASDATAQIWDIVSGKPISTPMTSTNPISRLYFSPDGQWLATASSNVVRMWEAKTGAVIGQPILCDGAVHRLQFNRAGDLLLTVSGNNAQVWDARSGKPRSPPLESQGKVNTACFSLDGNWIATASTDQLARVWNWKSEPPDMAAFEHDQEVISVGFIGTNQLFTLAPHAASIWDLDPHRLFCAYVSPQALRSLHSSGDGLLVDSESQIISVTRLTPGSQHTKWTFTPWQTIDHSLIVPVNKPQTATNDTRISASATGESIHLYSRFGLDMGIFFSEPFRNKDKWIAGPKQSYPALITSFRTGPLISMHFNYNNRKILALGRDGVARVWPVPFDPHHIPKWFVEFLYAYDPDRTVPQMRGLLKYGTGKDDFTRWGRWFFRLADSAP